MVGFYHQFTRILPAADEAAILTNLRATDASAGLIATPDGISINVKKSTDWTANQITAVQNIVNNAPNKTLQNMAQNEIDRWPISEKAFVSALVNQINVLRSKLSPPLPDITMQQVIQAIRNEAATL